MNYNYKVQKYLNEVQVSYYKDGIACGENSGKKKIKDVNLCENEEECFHSIKDAGLDALMGFGYSREELNVLGFSDDEIDGFLYRLIFGSRHSIYDRAADMLMNFGYSREKLMELGFSDDEPVEPSLTAEELGFVSPEDFREIEKKEPGGQELLDIRNRSIRRSKQTIYNYSRANRWDWFATFTFNGDKTDRYDYDICGKQLRQFFNNFKKRKFPEFEYLAVPERHKDGAWHFHVLIQGNIEPWLTPGYHKDRFVFYPFNRHGISEAERIRDTDAAAKYITKYITKEFVFDVGMKRRYFVSQGVKKAEELKFESDEPLIDFILANFPEHSMSYSRHNTKHIDAQYVTLKKNDGRSPSA